MKTLNMTVITLCAVSASFVMSNASASRYGPLGELLENGTSISSDFNRAARNPYDMSDSSWSSGQVTDHFNEAARKVDDYSAPTPQPSPQGGPPNNAPDF